MSDKIKQRNLRNRMYKGKLKSVCKKFDPSNIETFQELQSYYAKCRRKGIIKKNTADRMISKFAAKFKAVNG